jgi:PPOX class probable F420-dependent enzyme
MLTDKERQLLSGKNFVHLATVNADGSPQVSPVWVDVQDDLILINSVQGRKKVGNVTRDPRVALSVHDQENPYDMAAIRGKVVEVTENGAREHIDALSQKYLGKPYPWHREGDKRVIIKIKKLERS